MKNIFRITFIAALITSALFSTAKAQQFKTDESVSSQLKKGTAPGLKFAPVTTQLHLKQEKPAPEASIREKFSTSLKKGTLPGMRVAPGSSSTAFKAKRPVTKATGNVALASSTAVKKAEKAPAVKAPGLPTQDAPSGKQ